MVFATNAVTFGRPVLALCTTKTCYLDELVILRSETMSLVLQLQEIKDSSESWTIYESVTIVTTAADGIGWGDLIVVKSVGISCKNTSYSVPIACSKHVDDVNTIVCKQTDVRCTDRC